MIRVGVRLIRELVCDLCGSADQVNRWVLTREGKRRSPDLCLRHAKPLQELFDSLPEKRGNQGKRQVLTEAQVKQKARAYRSRQKRAAK